MPVSTNISSPVDGDDHYQRINGDVVVTGTSSPGATTQVQLLLGDGSPGGLAATFQTNWTVNFSGISAGQWLTVVVTATNGTDQAGDSSHCFLES
jgi:hypothetical protein